ncbi:hypothetical protein ATSB10_14890 [Dyella thiooxydans]|uniref:Preprotein translocase subunit SecD n=1 Tax=Dyella thiooxydans TaxID=445710 RepID=A0A160MZS8_9GAMM|nr:hypothetical protein ATSB10_14890 [Dyella thiooxydans]
MEREARGADALQVTQIDIERNAAFEEPVYELKIRIDPKSQTRLDASMRRAMDAHRALAFLVNGSVVFQTLVMGLPKDGVISLGGFSSKQEAEAAAAPFKAPPSRQ